MKQLINITKVSLVLILSLLILAGGLPHFTAQAATQNSHAGDAPQVCDATRSVQVSGTSVLNVIPDRALIQLGVQSNSSTPEKVQADNTTSINRVIKALKSLGIDEKDITTDWYVIEPVYENYDSLYIKGYRINNIIAVTLKDISKANQVIISALNASANQVIHVELYLSDLRKYRDEARELAIKAAAEKAQALASAAGAETSCVLSINENSWSSYNGWWYGNNQNLWTQNVVQNVTPSGSGGLSADGPVSLGHVAVRAEVNVSFGLK